MGVIGGGLLSAGLDIASLIGKEDDVPEPRPTITVTVTPTPTPPPPPPKVSFDKPQDGGTFPTCGTATGETKLADDQVVVVGEREDGDDRWYFESDVRYDGSGTQWRVHLQLGEATDKTENVKFDVIALVMPKKQVDYL